MDLNILEQKTGQLSHSIRIALDPNSLPNDRHAAHKIWEDFQKNSTPSEMIFISFRLIESGEVQLILSGFQFLEYVVKFHWNTTGERDEVKEKLFGYMRDLQQNQSTGFLREALTKVVVEIAKREWPQLWPDLFPKLCEISNTSDLPLLILRRLAEDVVILQNVDCLERRRDLNQSLNAIAEEVVTTLFNVLVTSVQKSTALINSSVAQEQQEALIYQRRGKISLECLLPYIEWVNVNWFIQDNRMVILFALLKAAEFRMGTADCIIALLERRPNRREDQFDIPSICLEEVNYLAFVQSIQGGDCKTDEDDFLRKCGNILNLLSSHSSCKKVNSENLLKAINCLSSRVEVTAVVCSSIAGKTFLKNLDKKMTVIEQDSYIYTSFILLFNQIIKKLIAPYDSNSDKLEYARLKSEFAQMLRTFGSKSPKLYIVAHSWLAEVVSASNLPTDKIVQNWECLSIALDSVSSTVSKDEVDIIKLGLQDIQFCLEKFINETNLEMKSVILSGISGLFVFLSLAKIRNEFTEDHLRMMKAIVESMFKCFLYEDCREIRRHCTSLLIKLGSKHPEVLVVIFDFIHSTALAVSSKMSNNELVNIVESLILISNAWDDTNRQAQYITSVISVVEWQEVIFLSQSPSNITTIFQNEKTFFEKRSILFKNISILHAIVKRIRYSSNTDQHTTTITTTRAQKQEPIFNQIRPLLPIILQLVKTLHSLYDNSIFTFFFDLNDCEKRHLLGNPGNNVVPNPNLEEKPLPEKIKTFIQVLLELCYGILGDSCYSLNAQLYTIPQIGDAYLTYSGWNLQKLSDFRVRNIVKFVYKPFLLCCPFEDHTTIIKPFFKSFSPFMLERLIASWAHEERTRTEGEGEEEKEVLESASLRLLTKEYYELLERILYKTKTAASNNNSNSCNPQEDDREDDTARDTMEMDETDSKRQNGNNNGNSNTYFYLTQEAALGEIGNSLLDDPVCFQSIIQLCINALCWSDSVISLKSTRVILQSWAKISQNLEVVRQIFMFNLRSLCLWHDNDGSFDAMCKIHDLIFLEFHTRDQTIIQMMIDWGTPQEEIGKLLALSKDSTKGSAKRRKDILRKLIRNNPLSLENNKSQKSQWLKNLPGLNIRNESKIQQKLSKEVDLKECFSQIHTT